MRIQVLLEGGTPNLSSTIDFVYPPCRWSGRSHEVASELNIPVSQKCVSQGASKQQGAESELTVICTCLMNINEASCL